MEKEARRLGVHINPHYRGRGHEQENARPYHHQNGPAGALFPDNRYQRLPAHYAVALDVAQVEYQRAHETQNEDDGEDGERRRVERERARYGLRQKRQDCRPRQRDEEVAGSRDVLQALVREQFFKAAGDYGDVVGKPRK